MAGKRGTISELFDLAEIEKQTSTTLDFIQKYVQTVEKANQAEIRLKGAASVRETVDATKELSQAQKIVAVATKEVENRMVSLNGKSSEFTRVLLNQTKAQKEAAAATTNEAKTRTENARTAREEAKARAENAKAKIIEERLTKSLVKEKEKLTKETLKEGERLGKLNNEYEQLKSKYAIAANTAKQLAAAKGLDNEETKEAITVSQTYYQQLLKIEQAVGQSQRQVGNYSQATFALTQVIREAPAFANSFATGISALSNNIPILADQFKNLSAQVGKLNAFKILAGSLLSFQALLPIGFLLLQAYSKEFGNFVSSLFSSKRAIDQTREAQEKLNKAYEAAEYKEVVSDLKEMTINIDLAKKGFLNKEAVLKKYNETIGESIGKANSLDQAEKMLIKNGPAFLQITLLKAAASLALAEAAQLAVDIARDQQDPNARNLAVTLRRTEAEQKFGKEIRQSAEYQKLLREENDAYNRQIASRTPENIAAFEKLKGSTESFFEEQLTFKAGGIKAQNKKTLEDIAASFQLKAAELSKKFNIDFFGGASDSKTQGQKEDNRFEKVKEDIDRAAAATAEALEIELKRQADFNKEVFDDQNKSLTERLTALRKYKELSEAIIDIRANTEKIIGQKTAEEIQLIEAKKFDSLIRLQRQYDQLRNQIKDEELAQVVAEEKRVQEALEKGIEERVKRDFKALEAITKKNQEEGEKTLANEKKLAEQRKQLQEKLVREIAELAFTLFTASIERQKNALQDQIDQLEQRKQKEIEVANQTITSTQERADAIAVIEARANAQREALQRRQRELDIRKARFDKAASIARIIQETAQNVVKYFGTPLAILAATIGAIQLAAVIAQPIPRYKHGKGPADDYEGPAIVGDGGKREAIIRPDGSVEVTGNKPELAYVTKRDVIHPDAEALLSSMIARNSASTSINNQVIYFNEKNITDTLDRNAKRLETIIKNKRELHIHGKPSGWDILTKRGNTFFEYVNENTQF